MLKRRFREDEEKEVTYNDVKNQRGYKPKSREELENIIKTSPTDADLNFLDVSDITDMSYLFDNSKFNGDISKWDVSNVEDMSYMFANSSFNGDISNWDVSNVKDMDYMFDNSKFNGDISKWDVSNVEDMYYMFAWSKFNGDISNWDVSNVEDMDYMFYHSDFNRDISKWDVSNVKDMRDMFANSQFNRDISNWDVSKVKYAQDIFTASNFKGDISKWVKLNPQFDKTYKYLQRLSGAISSKPRSTRPSNSEPYKYEVCVRPYDRTPVGDIPVKYECFAKSDLQALQLAALEYDAWDLDDWTDEDIESELEDQGMEYDSKSDLVDELDNNIDTGDAFIFYIKNLTTKRYIYKNNAVDIKDWMKSLTDGDF